MRTSKSVLESVLAITTLLFGCASIEDRERKLEGPEAVAVEALDSFRQPIDHGSLTLGTTVTASLAGDQQFHSWTFNITGPARIQLATGAPEGDTEVDTVLYLHREGSRGWGSHIARNDDSRDTLFSLISRSLPEGRYRVLVKGYDRRSVGAFELMSSCEGEGCPRTPPSETCAYGTSFRQLRDSASFDIVDAEKITIEHAGLLSEISRAQLITAVRVAYNDAEDVGAALQSVDQGEVNRFVLRARADGRHVVVLEYGAGDNSYGGVFEGGSTTLSAEIHDGDLYACTLEGSLAGARQGSDCEGEAPNTCDAGLECFGIDPSWGRGSCQPFEASVGQGETRSSRQSCPGDQLTCGGLTQSSTGTCVPNWMRRTFGEGFQILIPDGDGYSLERPFSVYGLGNAALDIVVRATIDHPRTADLSLTLTQPSGVTVPVWTGATSSVAGPVRIERVVQGWDANAPVNGSWELTLTDLREGQRGSLEQWEVEIVSRPD